MITETHSVTLGRRISHSTRFPQIHTKNLILEELNHEDAEEFFCSNDIHQMSKSVAWEHHLNTDESLNHFKDLRKIISLENGRLFLCWGVREKQSSNVIGIVNLTEIGPICGQIGFLFHHDWWTRNLPREALVALLNWSFQECRDFERVQSRCTPTNVNATALLERTGMILEGTNRAIIKVGNKTLDLNCYAMTRNQWKTWGTGPSWNYHPFENLGHI